MKRVVFLILVTSLLITAAQAQRKGVFVKEYASEITKREQGLSQNSVRCITQDSHGFMWFGTWDGLNRFNGVDFEIFRSGYSSKKGQLSNHTINVVFEDNKGILWIGTDKGLNRFNPKTEEYKSYFHNPEKPYSLSNDTVKSIVEDAKGNLWIGTQNGLNILQDTSGKFKRIKSQDQNNRWLVSNEIREIFRDSQNNIWVSTAHGLSKWIPGYGNFISFQKEGRANRKIVDNAVNSVIELPNDKMMVGTSNGISVLGKSGSELINFRAENIPGLKSNVIMDLMMDSEGKVWVATAGGGLSFFYPDEKRFTSLDEFPSYQEVNEDYANVVFEDRQGIIWIGYAWKGLKKIVPSRSYFAHYHQEESHSGNLLSNSVWSMTQISKNEFLIGTDKGINIFNDVTKSFGVLTRQDGLSSNNIRAMRSDSKGNVWIGTLNRGVMKYDPEENSFNYFGNKNTGKFKKLYDNTIWAILEGYKKDIWIGTYNGLFRLDPDSMKMQKYLHLPGDKNSLSNNIVYSLYEDQHHDIWIGTYGGLNKYDRSENQFEVFRHRTGNPSSISTNKIFGINQDADGYLWIGTRGGGLNRMNPYTEEFKHFTEQDGLPNNVVYDIIVDRMGYLWMSTNKGLSRFDPKNETFINYDINDGVQSYEFNLGAAFINSQGKIFMGGMNGFNVFRPSNIRKNQKEPELVVTQIKVLNEELPGTFFDGDTIILNHDDSFLSLEFAAIDYTNPIKNQYRYRMKPLNKEWISTTSDKNIAEFTELAPGNYVFHLIGSNSDGVWNEQGMELHIIVKPAWYQKGIVRYGSMTLLAGLLFLGVFARIRRIKKNYQIEKQFMELERKAMRLQMNPHFIFNTLNSIQNYILEHEKTSAISYLNKFSKMMRQVLYNSDKAYVPLSDEIELLNNFMELERLRFDKKFDYHVFIDENMEEDFIAIPPMLIQPHVENAILHGLLNRKDKHGELYLSFFEYSEHTIKCVVEDNGVGRKASRELQKKARKNHKSRGVSITKQRLEYINKINSTNNLSVDFKDKYDNNGNPEGTIVTLIIPVQDI